MARFTDHNFLITGGSSGIGWATAERLVSEGARVMVTGTNEQRLERARTELGVETLRNDAGDPDAAIVLAQAVEQRLGRLHGVFFNAGFGRFAPITDVSVEDFDAQYNVNVRGPLLQTKALHRLLGDDASIVLNASIAHLLGMEAGSVYGSSKGAVRTLTRVIARELAPRGIRVNSVSPGLIETNFLARTGMDDKTIAEFGEALVSGVPLGRPGRAEEIASVVAFLMSKDASYVTGIDLIVDGGMTQL